MRKIICLFLCSAVLLPLLTACRSSQQETTTPQPGPTQPTATQTISDPWADYNMPTADDDYWELLCENCSITDYLLTGGVAGVEFVLISARDLEGMTISITSSLGGTAARTLTALDEEPQILPVTVFLAYQNIDWASLKGDINALNKQIDEVYAAYEVARDNLPCLYRYKVAVSLMELGMDPQPDENGYLPSDDEIAKVPPQQMESLTVTLGEESKSYALGNIGSLPTGAAEKVGYENGITEITIAKFDYAAWPSKDGVLELTKFDYKTTADVVLQGISVLETTILQCEIKIQTPQGDKFSMRWDGISPIEVDEGSKITIENLVIEDSALANNLTAQVWRYVVLRYSNSGEEYNSVISVSIRMRQDPFDIYALKVDGVDMLPYYIEYKNYEE